MRSPCPQRASGPDQLKPPGERSSTRPREQRSWMVRCWRLCRCWACQVLRCSCAKRDRSKRANDLNRRTMWNCLSRHESLHPVQMSKRPPANVPQERTRIPMPRSGSGKQPKGHLSDLRVFASVYCERETFSGAAARVVGRTSEQEVHHVLDEGRRRNAPQKVEPLRHLPRDGCCA